MLPLKNTKMDRLSDEHAEYIKSLVDIAGKLDSQREVFGSGKHQYQLNPVLTMEEVRQYEAKLGASLPEEYVFFLTKVGNGGAGPYYGIYPLKGIEAYLPTERVIEQPAWLNSSLSTEDWNETIARLEDDQFYDAEMEKICSGMYVLGTQGCTYDHVLMNSGAEEGKMVIIDWNLDSDYVPVFTHMTFLEWYEQFFLEIISDNQVTSYGYVRLGTEQQLITDFEQAGEAERGSILRSFFRFKKLGATTLEFLLKLEDHRYDAERLELLLRFNPELGMKLFEEMLSGRNLQVAAQVIRQIPKEHYNTYYKQMLQLLDDQESSHEGTNSLLPKQRILYFLGECFSLSARDLQNFAMSDRLSEEERKTAIYIMGKATDRMDYLELFIRWMRGDSYTPAHTALQAMARTVCEELLDTYEWMWIKYNADECMRSNLRIAFETNGRIKDNSMYIQE